MPGDNHLLITGLVRDSGRHLNSEIERIERHALRIFATVEFLLVESDSTDKTVEVLETIGATKKNFEFVSLGKLANTYPRRFDRLRFCRNQYVNRIREVGKYQKCKFVLVVDFDIKNRSLDLSPINTLLSNQEWQGLFVNQKGPYYDILALRCAGWVEEDCFKSYHKLAKCMNRENAKEVAIWSQMKKIPINSPLIEVESAFGGMGLYRRECFELFDYGPISDAFMEESEHVSLHKKITSNGGKLFIVPAMTNFSFTPHNLSAYRIFRFLDRISRPRIFKGIRNLVRQLLP